jgi:prepilin signal peptidase PulO-like enzyme (type II secretory pathway)
MRRGGPTFWPALSVLVVSGGVLFFAEVTWLQMLMAVCLLVGIALGVFAIATPEFLEGDAED